MVALLAKDWNCHWVWWVGDFGGAIIAVILVKLVYVPGMSTKYQFRYHKKHLKI